MGTKGKKMEVAIANLAKKMASANANSCCMYVMYQKKLPDSVQKLKRR